MFAEFDNTRFLRQVLDKLLVDTLLLPIAEQSLSLELVEDLLRPPIVVALRRRAVR